MSIVISIVLDILAFVLYYIFLIKKGGKTYKAMDLVLLLLIDAACGLLTLLGNIPANLLRMTSFGTAHPLITLAVDEFIGTAMVEELIKFLILYKFLVKRGYAKTYRSSLVAAALAGLAFGVVENIMYARSTSLPIMIFRIIFSNIGHAMYTAIFVYHWHRWKENKTFGNFARMFFLPVFLHGLLDFAIFATPYLPEGIIADVFPLIGLICDVALTVLMVRWYLHALKEAETREVQ